MIRWTAVALSLAILPCFVSPLNANDNDDLKTNMTNKVNGLTFGGEQDDTRDEKKLGIVVGKSGVMHYVTSGHISVVDMKVDSMGKGRSWVGSYTIKVRLTAHKHSLHYKGVGGEAREDNDGDLGAEVFMRIEDGREGVKVLESKILNQSGEANPGVIIMVNAARDRIVQEIKKP